jgi:hypothetical protein
MYANAKIVWAFGIGGGIVIVNTVLLAGPRA